jgi:hypothetical protein
MRAWIWASAGSNIPRSGYPHAACIRQTRILAFSVCPLDWIVPLCEIFALGVYPHSTTVRYIWIFLPSEFSHLAASRTLTFIRSLGLFAACGCPSLRICPACIYLRLTWICFLSSFFQRGSMSTFGVAYDESNVESYAQVDPLLKVSRILE